MSTVYTCRNGETKEIEVNPGPQTKAREPVAPKISVRIRYRSEQFRFDVFADTLHEAQSASMRYLLTMLAPGYTDLPASLTVEPYNGKRRGVYPVFFDDGEKTIWGQKAMSVRKYD